jgi:chemotaxis protein CheD
MNDAKLIDIFLMPGDYFVGDGQYRVRTLLGSCVSITLWHPALRIGAMSHFLLPGHGRRNSDRPNDKPGLYGADAMQLMADGMAQQGVPLIQCQGKIFGGGAMFPRRARVKDIGMQNGDYARSMLQQHGIQVVSESLFGEGHRQLIFTIRNGEVLSRQVPPEPGWGNAGARIQA